MLVVMVDVWVAAGSSIVQGFNLACREVLAEVSIQITRLSAEVLHRTDGVVASQLLSNTVKLVVESLCKLSVNAYQFRTQRLVRFFCRRSAIVIECQIVSLQHKNTAFSRNSIMP